MVGRRPSCAATRAARIAFLRELVEKTGTKGLMDAKNPYYPSPATPEGAASEYFDYHRPGRYEFPLPENGKFKATLIDPFAMTADADRRGASAANARLR